MKACDESVRREGGELLCTPPLTVTQSSALKLSALGRMRYLGLPVYLIESL